MSGGSRDYECFRFEEAYSGRMYDAEMDALIDDLARVLHDVEWYDSGDIGEERYRKTIREFKDKWFGGGNVRLERIGEIVEHKLTELNKDIQQMIEGE